MSDHQWTDEDTDLLVRLEHVAKETFDGHLTVMRFTTNWRVAFFTPADRDDIHAMPAGKTFAEAAKAALSAVGEGWSSG